MTQCDKENIRKSTELITLFQTLDEQKQDSALHILRALGFAQSTLCEHSQITQKRSDEK